MKFAILLCALTAFAEASRVEDYDEIDNLMAQAASSSHAHHGHKHVHNGPAINKFIDQRDGKNHGVRLGSKYRQMGKEPRRTMPDDDDELQLEQYPNLGGNTTSSSDSSDEGLVQTKKDAKQYPNLGGNTTSSSDSSDDLVQVSKRRGKKQYPNLGGNTTSSSDSSDGGL